MSSGKSRNWCFTLNNPTLEEEDVLITLINKERVKFVFWQLERGEETNTPHFQGFVCFTHPVAMATAKATLESGRYHLEIMRGTIEDSIRYCSKPDGRLRGPYQYGEQPRQGARNDLKEVAEAIRGGASMRDLAESHPHQIIRYARGLQCLASYCSTPRSWVMDVAVYWGPTGSGKSRRANEELPGAYWKPAGPWWDGYDGQEDVIIDDFHSGRANEISITDLLRWLDRYPCRVPIKGGFVNFVARRVVITSNLHYGEWFPEAAAVHIAALERRFTRVEFLDAPSSV